MIEHPAQGWPHVILVSKRLETQDIACAIVATSNLTVTVCSVIFLIKALELSLSGLIGPIFKKTSFFLDSSKIEVFIFLEIVNKIF